MEIEDVKKQGIKKVLVSLRINPEDKKWVEENNISLGKVLRLAINELKDLQQTKGVKE